MRLKELIKLLGNYCFDSEGEDFQVQGIDGDSKKISRDFIFVAIKGNQTDGHKFIEEAIGRGAKAVVIQIPNSKFQIPKDITVVRVDDTRKTLAKLATEFYGNPSQRLKVMGITGTNGKTTVSYLIEAVLKQAGFNPAVVGTVNYRFQNKVIPAKNTTPGPRELQSLLAQILEEGSDYVIMETSSHALAQDRTAGIKFHSALFTNLTQDHLDYHLTLEDYFQAKLKLFKNLDPSRFAIVNQDDAYGRRIKGLISAQVFSYGIDQPADVVAKDIKFNLQHSEFSLVIPAGKINFKTRLIGRYNVYNILAATAWALKAGLDLAVIKSAMEAFSFVPGRLERINFNGDFEVFVDYAHTEDALRNVLINLRQLCKKRIIVVFGCGGERDKTKRPKMGYVVSELADYAVITSDNPRNEDPLEIINEIKKGISKDNYAIIPDRGEAIKKSLSLAKSGDIVLVAGKGHEQYQVLKDRILDFDDRQVVRRCLGLKNS